MDISCGCQSIVIVQLHGSKTTDNIVDLAYLGRMPPLENLLNHNWKYAEKDKCISGTCGSEIFVVIVGVGDLLEVVICCRFHVCGIMDYAVLSVALCYSVYRPNFFCLKNHQLLARFYVFADQDMWELCRIPGWLKHSCASLTCLPQMLLPSWVVAFSAYRHTGTVLVVSLLTAGEWT